MAGDIDEAGIMRAIASTVRETVALTRRTPAGSSDAYLHGLEYAQLLILPAVREAVRDALAAARSAGYAAGVVDRAAQTRVAS